jgi:hypothetical protein
MSWWQVLLLCWLFYMLGFATAALMQIARDDDEFRERNHKAMRSGVNDD